MVIGYARFHDDAAASADIGRLLLTELSCTSCHRPPAERATELAPKGGPRLAGAAKRLQSAWLRKFLANPQAVKPGATMPNVLHDMSPPQREKVIEALIAYLGQADYPQPKIVSTASNPVAPEFWRKGDAARGQQHYHQVGCVACHAPDEKFQPEKPKLSELEQKIQQLDLDPEELKELGLSLPQPIPSVPLPKLAEKHTAQSLTLFLVNPLLIRPAERMPHLQLAPHEAADIAAYLLQGAASETIALPSTDADLIREGAKWYSQLGCQACHGTVTQNSAPDREGSLSQAPPLDDLAANKAGCLAPLRSLSRADAHALPHYSLSNEQRSAMLGVLQDSNVAEQPSVFSSPEAQRMLQLNCYACHARDQRGGVGPKRWQFFENKREVDLGDEGRLPPPLDHVGAKLKLQWLENVLRGKGAVRPHFHARMPSFPQHAQPLAAAFREADKAAALSMPPLAELNRPQAETMQAGRRLLNTGCVQCHPLWGERLPGVMGVEISDVDKRITPHWFQAFLKNPAQWKHGTRMPTFFPNGKSTSPDILDGDVERQIAAMWTYLNAPQGELPEKLEQGRAHNFVLTPTDKPLVLRTFMQGNITHAIAVGFPERLHYAFDSEAMALPLLWRGDFLNAHPTWFDRFTPPTKPLGKIWRLPPLTYIGQGPSPPLELLPDAKITGRLPSPVPLQFSGYRLDSRRVPSLLYRVADCELKERIAPAAKGKGRVLRRRIQATVAGQRKQTLWLAVGLEPKRVQGRRAELQAGGVIESTAPLHTGKLAGATVVLTPLKMEAGRGTLEVRYLWNE